MFNFFKKKKVKEPCEECARYKTLEQQKEFIARSGRVILVNNRTGEIELFGNGYDYYHYIYKDDPKPLINPVTKEEIDPEVYSSDKFVLSYVLKRKDK